MARGGPAVKRLLTTLARPALEAPSGGALMAMGGSAQQGLLLRAMGGASAVR